MIIDYYDTSAILTNPSLINSTAGINYISHFVITELENIKNSNSKDEKVKLNARKAVRLMYENIHTRTDNIDYKKLEKIKKRNTWLPDNTDGNIIAEALLLKENGEQICFWTADYNMYLFCRDNFTYINFVDEKKTELWNGWNKYTPNEKDMSLIYSEPNNNVLGAKINEYCEIFEGNELKDVLRWDGEKYCNLKYKSFKSILDSKIEPRNTEQKMFFDLLQNREIPIKLCLGRFGSGKSYLMLAHALHLIQKGEFQKIVFVKNNIEVKDTNKIGSMAPLYSNI